MRKVQFQESNLVYDWPSYQDDIISPFLCVQPETEKLRFLGNTFDSLKDKISSITFARENLEYVSTIEEAEDHYLDQIACRVVEYDEKRYPYPVIFNINQQAAAVAVNCRRGLGWIALMHPVMLERLRSADLSDVGVTDIIKLTPLEEQKVVGRWRLVAMRDCKIRAIWTGEHLAENEVYVVYRSYKDNSMDGVCVMKSDNGFALCPSIIPNTNAPLSYISKWIYL